MSRRGEGAFLRARTGEGRGPRPWPLALALALTLLPLHALPPRVAAHPAGAEGAMGGRVLIMVESGARLPAPALGLLLLLPPVPVSTRRAHLRGPRRAAPPTATTPKRTRLVELGRLTLEGG